MAKLTLSPFIGQLHGKVGDLVFKRYGDEIIVTKAPDMSNVQWTAAQQATRARFRQAIEEARRRLADPIRRAEYAAQAQALGKPLFAVAMADCYRRLPKP